MRLILFGDTFVCLTQVDSSCSLMLPSPALSSFPPSALSDLGSAWRLLRVYEGPEANDAPGYLQHFTAPLHALALPSLAVSTSDSDLILVKTSDSDRALKCLLEVAQRLTGAPLRPPTLPPSPTPQPSGTTLTLLSPPLRLVTLPRPLLRSLAAPLTDLLSSPPRPGRFFSLASCGGPDALALVLDPLDWSRFTPPERRHLHVHPLEWRAILFDAGEGGFTMGAVSELSGVLAGAGLSIYYLSACNEDYILVQHSQVDRALLHLRAVFRT